MPRNSALSGWLRSHSDMSERMKYENLLELHASVEELDAKTISVPVSHVNTFWSLMQEIGAEMKNTGADASKLSALVAKLDVCMSIALKCLVHKSANQTGFESCISLLQVCHAISEAGYTPPTQLCALGARTCSAIELLIENSSHYWLKCDVISSFETLFSIAFDENYATIDIASVLLTLAYSINDVSTPNAHKESWVGTLLESLKEVGEVLAYSGTYTAQARLIEVLFIALGLCGSDEKLVASSIHSFTLGCGSRGAKNVEQLCHKHVIDATGTMFERCRPFLNEINKYNSNITSFKVIKWMQDENVWVDFGVNELVYADTNALDYGALYSVSCDDNERQVNLAITGNTEPIKLIAANEADFCTIVDLLSSKCSQANPKVSIASSLAMIMDEIEEFPPTPEQKTAKLNVVTSRRRKKTGAPAAVAPSKEVKPKQKKKSDEKVLANETTAETKKSVDAEKKETASRVSKRKAVDDTESAMSTKHDVEITEVGSDSAIVDADSESMADMLSDSKVNKKRKTNNKRSRASKRKAVKEAITAPDKPAENVAQTSEKKDAFKDEIEVDNMPTKTNESHSHKKRKLSALTPDLTVLVRQVGDTSVSDLWNMQSQLPILLERINASKMQLTSTIINDELDALGHSLSSLHTNHEHNTAEPLLQKMKLMIKLFQQARRAWAKEKEEFLDAAEKFQDDLKKLTLNNMEKSGQAMMQVMQEHDAESAKLLQQMEHRCQDKMTALRTHLVDQMNKNRRIT